MENIFTESFFSLVGLHFSLRWYCDMALSLMFLFSIVSPADSSLEWLECINNNLYNHDYFWCFFSNFKVHLTGRSSRCILIHAVRGSTVITWHTLFIVLCALQQHLMHTKKITVTFPYVRYEIFIPDLDYSDRDSVDLYAWVRLHNKLLRNYVTFKNKIVA